MKQEKPIDIQIIQKSAVIIKAINHKLRHKIIQLIHEKERLSVSQIYKSLQIEQSEASQHLRILRNAGFVLNEREGQLIYYRLDQQRLKEVQEKLKEIIL